jgi:PUA domain protein
MRAEEIRFDNATVYLLDGKPWKLKTQEHVVPWLTQENNLKKVVIDMGAVPFIANGADVMGQGITKHDSPTENELVSIVDEKNLKQIAIGLVITKGIQSQGKTIKVLHYAGDKYWTTIKTLLS